MADEVDNLVLKLLREMREQMVTKADLAAAVANLATKEELADSERRIRADVASDMLLMRKELSDQIAGVRKDLSEQIVGLRRDVVVYDYSVVGHGVLLDEHDGRLNRVEKQLSLR